MEAQARRLGRAAGEKVVAYAKAQGWIAAPEAAAARAGGEARQDAAAAARSKAGDVILSAPRAAP